MNSYRMVRPLTELGEFVGGAYLGGERERRIHISILDMLYLTYLLDVRVEMSGRQLGIQVWNSGERLGLKIKIRESSTYR